MPFGVLQEMPGVSEAEYRLVEQHLGPDRPPGLLAHVAGIWLITAVNAS